MPKQSESLSPIRLDTNTILCVLPVVALILLMVFVDYHSSQSDNAERNEDIGEYRIMTRSRSKRLAEEMSVSKYKIDTPAAE